MSEAMTDAELDALRESEADRFPAQTVWRLLATADRLRAALAARPEPIGYVALSYTGKVDYAGLIFETASKARRDGLPVCALVPVANTTRLIADIEEMADGYGHADQIAVANDLTAILARHRQASA